MNLLLKNVKIFLLCAACLLCLLAVPACMTFQRPTAEAPFVINFEFLTPVMPKRGEESQLLAALNSYAVPETTRVYSQGRPVWPLPVDMNRIKTDRITKSGDEISSHSNPGQGQPVPTCLRSRPVEVSSPFSHAVCFVSNRRRFAPFSGMSLGEDRLLRVWGTRQVGDGSPDRAAHQTSPGVFCAALSARPWHFLPGNLWINGARLYGSPFAT